MEAGLSLPTESITEFDSTPERDHTNRASPMHFDSGGESRTSCATAAYQLEAMSSGGHLRGTVRLGESCESRMFGTSETRPTVAPPPRQRRSAARLADTLQGRRP
jgi:hypothetical protein